MKKQEYEKMKTLREKVEAGTATFVERNIYRIILKKHKNFHHIKSN